ncbi:RluA family pseudouridine synthase [Patescibacteria group bacterium]
MRIDIIFENSDIIVIDKPAGLLVHPTHKKEKDTLIDWLINYYPEIRNVGDDKNRPGIVHRLDKDTSGLLIIVKNNKYFDYLKKLFANRKIEKKYLALVVGHLKEKKGIITKSISLSKKNYKKRSALLDSHSKTAITKYKVIKEYKDYSLLEISPKTGRTHQIRIHLSSIGYPIAGDKQYKFKRQICPEKLTRQFLHAKYLKFQLTSGKIVEFKSELPKDLKEVIDNLKI